MSHVEVPSPSADRGRGGSEKTKALVLTGLLAALTCVATQLLKIASPTGGYLNLGDALVLLSAYLLGPLYGAAAAGIGSALADLLGGYPLYAPATLVIKAVMALVAAVAFRRRRRGGAWILLCGIAGEIPMVLGYWLFDGWLLQSLSGAAAGLPSNLAQAAFGAAASTALTAALRSSGYVRREFPHLA